ncbi:sugar porter family MFS transporter [Parasediminibacterium sp. JCM 36343]|uniref:sugar porter family MFS transporter n=1 Tax=Parasediminibacterium sp. JCM 36343 TaxID=3374279 RepID=UPI00397E66C0
MNKKFSSTYIIGIAFISALGGYLFGFDFAVISGALPFLKDQFGLDAYMEGFATGSLALGAIIGCLVAGRVSEKFGRKRGLLVAASIFGLSSLAMAFAANTQLFIVARFFAGVGVGMASMLSPMYIAEIAPAPVRGRMVAINQLTIVLGILITNLVNYSLRNSGVNAWRWMFGLGAIPSTLFFLGVLWIPESPRWLLKMGRKNEAEGILQKIGGSDYATETIVSINKTFANTTTVSFKTVFEKAFLPAVSIGICLSVLQQFCGINVVFNYTATIFESIGASKDDQLLQTVFIGAINLIFTLLAMALVDKLGRKPLMLIGFAGLAILYIIITVLIGKGNPNVSWFLLAAIGLYASTLAPVIWVLISEIFPNKVRTLATTIAVVGLWAAYFILTFTFPILYEQLKEKTFYIYSAICAIGFWFMKIKVKETKGATLEEMDTMFSPH